MSGSVPQKRDQSEFPPVAYGELVRILRTPRGRGFATATASVSYLP